MKARRPLLILLLAVLAVAAWYWDRFRSFADAPLPGIQADAGLVVARGDNLDKATTAITPTRVIAQTVVEVTDQF